jgi:stage II sporulation protein D
MTQKHGDFDVCDDENCCLGYAYQSVLLEAYGTTDYPYGLTHIVKSLKTIDALNATDFEFMTFEDLPIQAMFFKSSWGHTLDSEYASYLKGVISPEKKIDAEVQNRVKIKFEDVLRMLRIATGDDSVTFADYKKMKIQSFDRAGSVETVSFGAFSLSGQDFMKALNLQSPCFSISVHNAYLKVLTYGEGSGVGLSLMGATMLGDEGYDYHSVLSHFYSGVEFSTIK